MKRVYYAIGRYLGLSDKVNYTKKFTLKNFDISQLPTDLELEQSQETIHFTRTRSKFVRSWIRIVKYKNGRFSYSFYYRKMAKKEEERIELIRQISATNFDAYYRNRDKRKEKLLKDVIVFIWEDQMYRIETFDNKEGEKVTVVRVNSDHKKLTENLPPFLNIGDDVSEDKRFFTINLR
jgi:hypothetical protein